MRFDPINNRRHRAALRTAAERPAEVREAIASAFAFEGWSRGSVSGLVGRACVILACRRSTARIVGAILENVGIDAAVFAGEREGIWCLEIFADADGGLVGSIWAEDVGRVVLALLDAKDKAAALDVLECEKSDDVDVGRSLAETGMYP